MTEQKTKAAAEPPLDCHVGRWPNLDHPAVTVSLGRHVYSLRVEDGEVVIEQLTVKDAAIDEIQAQPFYAPNA